MRQPSAAALVRFGTPVVDRLARATVKRVEERGAALFPPEIGFLAAQGVEPDLLLEAGATARRIGVTADRALLADGFPPERFYALLARHLGAPFLGQPGPELRALGRIDDAGGLTVADDRRGMSYLLAPRGKGVAALLAAVPPGGARPHGLAITTPRELDALAWRRDSRAAAVEATHGLGDQDPAASARAGARPWQVAVGAALPAAIGSGLVCYPEATWALGAAALSLLFLAAVLLRLMAAVASGAPDDVVGRPASDHELPVYTVIVPLFRETRVLAQLVAGLDAIDYPRAKLDIKLMVEESDPETIAAVEALHLPDRYQVIAAPPGHPQTKPRALNIGLSQARGDFVVVYDAEDIPAPGQLRAAVARFRARPNAVACLQARLAIDHREFTWLTRLYMLEYEVLFGVIKPGLARLGLPIPLGGTSNHFRTAALRQAGGWDAWNVTEDIDLGFRLARRGFRVETLESWTFEEAPKDVPKWLSQRARWLKGWMVTLVVHTREPVRLVRELGVMRAATIAVSLFGTVLSCLVGPFAMPFAVAAIARTWSGQATTGQGLWAAAGTFLLLAGLASLLMPLVQALRRSGRLGLLGWSAALPVYLVLTSIASWRAVYEGLVAPQRWNKTEHGLAARSTSSAP